MSDVALDSKFKIQETLPLEGKGDGFISDTNVHVNVLDNYG